MLVPLMYINRRHGEGDCRIGLTNDADPARLESHKVRRPAGQPFDSPDPVMAPHLLQ